MVAPHENFTARNARNSASCLRLASSDWASAIRAGSDRSQLSAPMHGFAQCARRRRMPPLPPIPNP